MAHNRTIITQSSQETKELGKELAASVGRGAYPRIICLYGQLGSGKTTFVQGFAQGLGLATRLLSPTFIIVRRYSLPEPEKFFYHVDLYRIQQEGELNALGLVEIFADDQAYVAIEWAERLGGLLPQRRLDMHFALQEDGRHAIQIADMYEKR